jgi:hypothetical protein
MPCCDLAGGCGRGTSRILPWVSMRSVSFVGVRVILVVAARHSCATIPGSVHSCNTILCDLTLAGLSDRAASCCCHSQLHVCHMEGASQRDSVHDHTAKPEVCFILQTNT